MGQRFEEDLLPTPQHVAIIMDGNGRWAKAQGLPRVDGHRKGAESVRAVLEEARRLGIRYITLYAFSTENWNRPKDEVAALMSLFIKYLESELPLFLENDIRLRAIGDLSRLPEEVFRSLHDKIEKTSHCASLDLLLAVSYGGRDEIVRACRSLVQQCKEKGLSLEDITEASMSRALDTRDIPDPDLLIRTSNEFRISNFLLWQLAYSEIVVTETHWPDFREEQLRACIDQYRQRDRRFGKVGE
ncbi:MAG: isoprenyl transferase [Bdellovibrionales bacterium]|nr:isoprenyl transferase [Bdellovibrionales bacterium]